MATKSIRLSNGTDTLLPESATSGSGYQKCADGTLICYGSVAFLASAVGGQTVSVTFPIAFNGIPRVTISPKDTSNFYTHMDNVTVLWGGATPTSATTLYAWANRKNAQYNWYCDYIAIGRWK